MPAPSKMKHRAEIAALLQRRKLAFSGIIGLAALLLLGPLVLSPVAFEMFASLRHKTPLASKSQTTPGSASPWRDPSWAGGLESPRSAEQLATSTEVTEPLTSASYTSGFDEKAAGLEPLPPAAPLLRLAQPHDSRACPDDLNCAFRAARGTNLPPRRPAATPVVFKHVKTASVPASASQPGGFALPLLPARIAWPSPHFSLPTANSLLTPFAFVSNTVVSFVKKL